MRLSNRTEYALLALIFLGRRSDASPVHGQEIAKVQRIPMPFLRQILLSLKQAHLVKSIKGRSGGYALCRAADKISVAEIVRLFDGPLAPTRSVSKFFQEDTPIVRERKVTSLMREVRDVVAKRLENTFLSDIL
ncbi:MAG: Rrf2 family transcriptional regulator [Deltaproteobacteria bacterium]|nr:Rrf2 family transcriptional regulator [Deltaproteobacteria bacterium]